MNNEEFEALMDAFLQMQEEDDFASDYPASQHEDGSVWSISYPGCIEHAEEVASDLGFEHEGELDIKAYLVSNKIFLNMIGESNFKIISLNELNNLLEALYG